MPHKDEKRVILDDKLNKVKDQVETFLNDTETARNASERDRDYVDHKQWTTEEINKLVARRQAPIVVNRVKPKVEGLKGLVSLRSSDPKAFPRTPKHDEAAQAVTDALRFVTDNNDFNESVKLPVAEDFFVEGYGGAIVDVQENGAGQVEVRIEQIPWDRIYFDPHSRKKDFSDARYMGMIVWMGKDEFNSSFPDLEFDTLVSLDNTADETFEDRPRWLDRSRDRVRVALHFFLEGTVWNMAMFTDSMFLLDPDESPFLDEFDQPTNPIELVCAYIDRDNQRYGEVRGFIDQQDEINHRRSKFLHLLSQRQTASRQGVIKDIDAMKHELAKPDGHVEYHGESTEFQVLPTGDMAEGQIILYQDSKAELDAISFNAQLAGERQSGDLSGRAIDKLQAAGTIELNSSLALLNGWEKRIYRQCWARIKQFWDSERWVRVTDDRDDLRWVGFNTEITLKTQLEEIINDEAKPLEMRMGASAVFQEMIQNQDPRLSNIVEVQNQLAELDMDIILEQSFDTVNAQQEQFQLLLQFGQGGDVDIIDLIELSNIRDKDKMISKIQERRQGAQEATNAALQVAEMEAAVDMRETNSKAVLNEQKAIQTNAETIALVRSPDTNPQVIV